MSLVKFLTSKTFFINLGIALAIGVVVALSFLKVLEIITQHNVVVKVPKLLDVTAEAASEQLEQLNLELVILDTIPFNDKIKPYAIVEQDPAADMDVKNGRKIYVQINAGDYDMVRFPDIKEGTSLRQVQNMLRSASLEIGEITYKKHDYKDVILGLIYKGRPITAGEKIKQHSKVDLILGDGFTKPNAEEQTIVNEQNLINAPEIEEVEGAADGE
nr:PASTA domain-containing protein [uncultured Flavobacterium sp.]